MVSVFQIQTQIWIQWLKKDLKCESIQNNLLFTTLYLSHYKSYDCALILSYFQILLGNNLDPDPDLDSGVVWIWIQIEILSLIQFRIRVQ